MCIRDSDVPVLAGAGLGLVRVHNKVMRALLHLLRHEGPFEASRESGTAAATQTRLFDDVDDRFRPLFEYGLGAIPLTAPFRGIEAPILVAVQVREDTIFIDEAHDCASVSVVRPPSGSEDSRSTCGPTLGCSPRRIAARMLSIFGPSRSSYGSLSIRIIGAFTQAPRHS